MTMDRIRFGKGEALGSRVPNYSLARTDLDRPVREGEGITRTSAKHSRLYGVAIWFSSTRPLRCTIRATSRAQAEEFARNRHPTLTRLEID